MSILQHPTKAKLRYRTPIDPDDTRWVYKSFELLDDNVSVAGVEVILENCSGADTLTDFSLITTAEGDEADNTWGVQITEITPGASYISITWRCTTAVSGDPDLGEQFDKTDFIPVKQL